MNKSIMVSLVGARGYVGKELINLLKAHPNFHLSSVHSRGDLGKNVYLDDDTLQFQDSSVEAVIKNQADIYILALPNGFCDQYAQEIMARYPAAKIIDLSSDKRFEENWKYSIPEIHYHENLQYISNPGCYATAIQLSITPILGLIDGSVHSFGISGFSGAGTTASDKNDPEILKNNIIPYQLTGHTHQKEVSHTSGQKIKFSPHVADFFRGLGVTTQATLKNQMNEDDLFQLYDQFYKNYPLVKITKCIPFISNNAQKPWAVIGGFSVLGKDIALHATLDNLLKGAAIQAIQNLNLAFKFDMNLGIYNE